MGRLTEQQVVNGDIKANYHADKKRDNSPRPYCHSSLIVIALLPVFPCFALPVRRKTTVYAVAGRERS